MDNGNEKKLTNYFDALHDSIGVTASQVGAEFITVACIIIQLDLDVNFVEVEVPFRPSLISINSFRFQPITCDNFLGDCFECDVYMRLLKKKLIISTFILGKITEHLPNPLM